MRRIESKRLSSLLFDLNAIYICKKEKNEKEQKKPIPASRIWTSVDGSTSTELNHTPFDFRKKKPMKYTSDLLVWLNLTWKIMRKIYLVSFGRWDRFSILIWR